MEVWYFETSAVNKLITNPELGTIATKRLQLSKGRDWRISPVTIWEILMTSDESKRDLIVEYCQHLFSRELLPSPGELIIPWIQQGMPISEKKRPLISQTPIASTWRDMVDDTSRQFIYDQKDLRNRVKLFQGLGKDLHKILKNEDVFLSSDNPLSSQDATITSLVEELPFIKNGHEASEKEKRAYKLSIFFITFILCAEGDIDNVVIKDYWDNLGINETIDRIRYVIHELPMLVQRGPFITMAYMTLAQSETDFSRGLWYDCLHCLYLPYVDRLFTNDNHFRQLKNLVEIPVITGKIVHMDEVELITTNKNWLGLES